MRREPSTGQDVSPPKCDKSRTVDVSECSKIPYTSRWFALVAMRAIARSRATRGLTGPRGYVCLQFVPVLAPHVQGESPDLATAEDAGPERCTLLDMRAHPKVAR
jgi:hypothetical protein